MADDLIAMWKSPAGTPNPGLLSVWAPGVGAIDRALNYALPLIRFGAAARHRAFPRPICFQGQHR
jgi:hypothetical protein